MKALIEAMGMAYIFNTERIREKPVSIDISYDYIPHSSLFLLASHSDFRESLFNKFGNEFWKKIIQDLFIDCLVNLLLSERIQAVYFLDKRTAFFKLIKKNSEGFNISCGKHSGNDNLNDILSDDVIEILSKPSATSRENFPGTIRRILDRYIGTGEVSRPEKTFFNEYLKVYSQWNQWLELKEHRRLLGMFVDFQVELDLQKMAELNQSKAKIDRIKYNLRKSNTGFRHFLIYAQEVIDNEFNRRYPSGD